MKALTLLLLMAAAVPAQTVASGTTVLGATVAPQAKLNAPLALRLAAGERAVHQVRVYHIATPSDLSRVRVYARLVDVAEGIAVEFDAVSWRSASGRRGTLSRSWQEVAVSSADVSEFGGTVAFILRNPAAEAASVVLEWRFEII